jgi:hypothetical protein
MNDDEPIADELETARRLARDPNALYALIDALPDPRAVLALKALAPALARHHRRLLQLEAFYRARLMPRGERTDH